MYKPTLIGKNDSDIINGLHIVCIKRIDFSDGTSHEVGQKMIINEITKYYYMFPCNQIHYCTLSDYILYYQNKEP